MNIQASSSQSSSVNDNPRILEDFDRLSLNRLFNMKEGLVQAKLPTPNNIRRDDQNRGGEAVYDDNAMFLKNWLSSNGHNLAQPIIDTFNSFLDNIPKIMSAQIINAPDKDNHSVMYKVRIQNVRIFPPHRDTQGGNPTMCFYYGKKFAARVMGDIVHYKPELDQRTKTYNYPGPTSIDKDVTLFDIPLMVGCKLDPTVNLSPRELDRYRLSPDSPKGYFIVDGAPRILISQQRGRFNQILVQDHKEDNKTIHDVYLTSMSDSGSEQVTLRYDPILGIGYRFRFGHPPHLINVWWIIRTLAGLALNTYAGLDTSVTAKFFELANDTSGRIITNLILSFIDRRHQTKVLHIIEKNITSSQLSGNGEVSDVNWAILKAIQPSLKEENREEATNEMLANLHIQLFPNMRHEPDNFTRRIYTLALMTARLAERLSGVRKPHGMDEWGNKRIDSPGQLLEVFLIRMWAEHVTKANNGLSGSNMWGGNTATIVSALNLSQITVPIWNSLKQQKWLLNKKSKNHENVIQIPKTPNLLAFYRKIMAVNISVNRDNPNREVRFAVPSQTGYIDFNDTPDGKSCGLMLRMTVLMNLSVRRNETPIRDIIDRYATLDIGNADNNHSICMLNGKFMGWAPTTKLRDEVRQYKISTWDYRDIEVAHVKNDNLLTISTDATRPIRPLLIVKKYGDRYRTVLDVLTENTGLNPAQITDISRYLVENNAIEYISPLEQNSVVIAQTTNDLDIYHARYLLAAEQVERLTVQLAESNNLWNEDKHAFEPQVVVVDTYNEWATSISELIKWGDDLKVLNIIDDDIQLILDTWNNYIHVVQEIMQYEPLVTSVGDVLRTIDYVQQLTTDTQIYNISPVEIQRHLEEAKITLYKADMERRRDYCEIDPAGGSSAVISHIPHANMSEGYRQSYASSQLTQALGRMPLKDIRTEAEPYLVFPQAPSSSNPMQDISGVNKYPSGQQVIIAVMQMGHNQEDATITFSGAVERGLFMYELNHKYNDKAEAHEEFVNPTLHSTGRNTPGIYNKIGNDGFPIVNALIKSGDCIIGKVVQDTEGKYRDSSTYMENGLYGTVRRVIIQGAQIRVEISSVRLPQSGDKFANMAQKSVLATILPVEDMPWIANDEDSGDTTMNGIRPSIVINPLSIPSRMTINYLLGILLGLLSAITGLKASNTAYRDFNMTDLKNELLKHGYNEKGTHVMYNPTTGERMVSEILVGPSHYDSLSHLAEKKHQSLGVGAVSNSTFQPVNKKKSGGLRLGEMEQFAIGAHGMNSLMTEKFGQGEFSAGGDCVNLLVCKQCGHPIPDTNNGSLKHDRPPSCEFCRYTDEDQTKIFSLVQMPYIMNVVRLTLQGMGIGMVFKTSPNMSKISDLRTLKYLQEMITNPNVNRSKIKYLVHDMIREGSISLDHNRLEIPYGLVNVPPSITLDPQSTQGIVSQEPSSLVLGAKGRLYTESTLKMNINDISTREEESLGEVWQRPNFDESSLAASSSGGGLGLL